MNLRVVGRPERIPGICAICLESNPGRCVDTGRDWKNWGHGYICADCVDECRKALGQKTQRQAENLENKNQELVNRLAELEAKVAESEDALDKLSEDLVQGVLSRIEKGKSEPIGERVDTSLKGGE